MTRSAVSLVHFSCGHSIPQGRGGLVSLRPFPCPSCGSGRVATADVKHGVCSLCGARVATADGHHHSDPWVIR